MNKIAVRQSWSGRQRLLARLTPIGPILLLAGAIVAPVAADDFSRDPKTVGRILNAVADDRQRSGVGGFLIVVGLAALLPGLALVIARVTDHGRTLATIGGALAMIGVTAGAIANTFFFVSFALTAPNVRAAEASKEQVYAALGPVLWPCFLLYLFGTVVGFLLLGVAVFRGKTAPRWAALLLPVAGIGISVVTGVLPEVALVLVLLIALLGCGILHSTYVTDVVDEMPSDASNTLVN